MKRLRVFLIDDDAAFSRQAAAVLTEAKYSVAEADDFSAAERLLKEIRGRAVVIAARSVRGACGLGFLQQTLRKYPCTPFILTAASPKVDDVVAAMRGGAHDFLRKPVDPGQLAESVARCMQRLDFSLETERQEKDTRNRLTRALNDLEAIRTASTFKGFMISMAAHDFRSILTVLDGYHQILLKECVTCGRELPWKMLEQTGRTIFRLRAMAGMLLDFEAAEKGEIRIEPRPFDLSALLDESAAFYRPYAAQKRVDLDIEAPLPAMRAFGDAGRVAQILDNLLYNAVKFTPADGRIRIGGQAQDGEYVTAWIRDTGAGIHKAMRKDLLGETVASDRKGGQARVGLGLTICQRLVEIQNGKLQIESAPGKGTQVFLSLPVQADFELL